MKKKILSLMSVLLISTLLIPSLSACKNNTTPPSSVTPSEPAGPASPVGPDSSEVVSAQGYDAPILSDTIEIDVNKNSSFTPVDVKTLPEGLGNFLAGMAWTWAEYNPQNIDIVKNGVALMLGAPYVVCDFSLYSDYIDVPEYDKCYDDPSFCNSDGYFVYDEEGVDWILTNIYNVPDTILSKLKDNSDNQFLKYENNQYLAAGAGIGGGFFIYPIYAEKDGDVYNIIYQEENVYTPGERIPRFAVMEYKTIDGKGYWTIKRNSATPIFDPAEDVDPYKELEVEGFTDDELRKMTNDYIESKEGVPAPEIDIFPSGDGTVSIHVYEEVEEEDDNGEKVSHIATWAWYTIDRKTGKGNDDVTGEEVDLTK